MKRIFRKNQIVVAALALLIAGAGYLNYTYENDEKDIATMAAKDSKEEKAKDTEATASLSEEEILTDTEASSDDMGDDSAGETVLTDSTNV